MRLIVSLGLFVLILSNISARELRGERRYRKYGIYPPKDKRGTDYSTNHGPKSYFTPIHGPIGGRSISGSSSDGSGPGHSNLQSLEQLSLRHGPNPSSLSSSGFGQLGSNHGFSLASLGLGGHSGAQSGYSFPYFSQALSKNGPVTFGLHGGSPPINSASSYMSPIYATGAQGLSAFGSGGSHGLNIPIMSLGSPGSPYSLQDSPVASHTVSGGFTIGSPHGSLPPSSSSSSSPSSSSYPSASSSLSSYSSPSSSSSYSSPSSYSSSANYHVGLSSGSSDSSSYQLPISSASYPVESGSYNSGYQPASSEGSTYASTGGSGYSFPSASYGNPSSAYSSSHSGSSYSRPTVTYSQPGSSNYLQSGSGGYDNQSPNYSSSSMTYSSPISGYSNTVEYDPSQQQSSSSYEAAPEQQGSYSQINPMYLAYAAPKSYDNSEMMQPKYDTISYSSPNGKY